jgi:hypothetical protein
VPTFSLNPSFVPVLLSFLLGVASIGIAGEAVGCNQCKDICPEPYDGLGYCTVQNGTCLLDGEPLAHCEQGICPQAVLRQGDTLSLPIGEMWSILGSRDDLHIGFGCEIASDASATDAANGTYNGMIVLFDGIPFSGCTSPPLDVLVCPNVPKSVQHIELRAAQGPCLSITIEIQDDECQATHPVCPR